MCNVINSTIFKSACLYSSFEYLDFAQPNIYLWHKKETGCPLTLLKMSWAGLRLELGQIPNRERITNTPWNAYSVALSTWRIAAAGCCYFKRETTNSWRVRTDKSISFASQPAPASTLVGGVHYLLDTNIIFMWIVPGV